MHWAQEDTGQRYARGGVGELGRFRDFLERSECAGALWVRYSTCAVRLKGDSSLVIGDIDGNATLTDKDE